MTNPNPSGETPENVAALATRPAALDHAAVTLLGVFGSSDSLRALVRLPGGRIRQVEPGQRLGLGRIAGIDATGLMLTKNGRTDRIAIPGG